jgi:hypothetical protein
VLLAPSAHAQTRWATYTNVRFAFAVDYPRDIFTGYAEADNSAGAIFKTDAPGVEMRAWGSYNVEKKSPRAVSPSATPARIKTRRSIIRRSSATLLSSPASSAAPWDARRLGQFECDHHGALMRLFARNTKEIGRLRRKASCALRRRCRKQAVLPDGTE